MRFRFLDEKLRDLYTAERGARAYPSQVIEAFFEAMAVIAAMPDERGLRLQKGFRYEKLKGRRAKERERSLRLNDQWRLVVKPLEDSNGRYLLVVRVEDYH